MGEAFSSCSCVPILQQSSRQLVLIDTLSCPGCLDQLLHRFDCGFGLSVALRVGWGGCSMLEAPLFGKVLKQFG